MLHILGDQVTDEHFEPGYLATDQEFENVRIRVKYRWGVSAVLSSQPQQARQRPPLRSRRRRQSLAHAAPNARSKRVRRRPLLSVESAPSRPPRRWSKRPGRQPHRRMDGSRRYPAAPPPQENHPQNPPPALKIKDGNFEKLDDWNVVEVIFGDRPCTSSTGAQSMPSPASSSPTPRTPANTSRSPAEKSPSRSSTPKPGSVASKSNPSADLLASAIHQRRRNKKCQRRAQ